MTYNERYEELKNKAFAEGRKHWRGVDYGIGYWVVDFTAEETAELNALYAEGQAAFEKIKTEKKAEAEAAKKRAAKRVEELKAELARVAAELEAAEKKLAEM